MHLGAALATELDRVVDQILEQLDQLRRVPLNYGQFIVSHLSGGLLDDHLQIGCRDVHQFVAVRRSKRLASRSHARVRQQVVDQRAHSSGRLDCLPQVRRVSSSI
jgi:hypothetical protein